MTSFSNQVLLKSMQKESDIRIPSFKIVIGEEDEGTIEGLKKQSSHNRYAEDEDEVTHSRINES